MRFKSMLAVALGLAAMGMGVWRLTESEMGSAAVAFLAGVFLLVRGLSNTVRPGL